MAVVAAFVGMGMCMALIMQMVVGMGMFMIVLMAVGVVMGMDDTVVGMRMGVGMLMAMAMATHMIVMDVHGKSSLHFSFIILRQVPDVKTFIFVPHPPTGLAKRREIEYNDSEEKRGGMKMEHSHNEIHAHSHGHVHENQKAVVNRLARAIGHLEKVKRMVEEGCDCSEVLVQLAAVRSAIDNTGKVILQDHMRHCMVDAVEAGDTDAIEDLCRAVERYMK